MTQDASGQAGSVKIVDALGIRATVRDLSGNDALNVALVDASGNQITSFGGTSMTDDSAFTAGSSSVVPVGGIVTADSVDSGDTGAFAMLANRQQKVTLYDSSGVEQSVGGGTQYTEDAAAAADPVGTALIMVRDDALSGQTTTDGDNVAARGTDNGELYVKHADTIAVTQSGTWDEVGINDSGNSITVDNPQLSVVGSGTEAAAMRVTIATDSTGVLSVDDNGGSLTVDGSVSVSGAVDTELTTADLDTGVGTDTRAVVGLVGTASGGGALIPGSATDGLLVNLGANNDVGLNAGVNNIGDVDVLSVPAPLSTTGGGTEATALRVTLANDSTGLVSIDDNGGSLTIDNAQLSVVGGGTEAAAMRVTIASDSTGVLSIDDNGGSLTVDGTVAVTLAAGAAAIAKAEDVASADADVGVPAMAVRKATPANTSGLDGDYEMLQISAGRLWASATIDAALPAGTNNIGDVDVLTLPALVAGSANIGDVDVLTVPAPLSTTGGGTEATALRVTVASDSTGVLSVDDNGGSLTVDVGTALPAGTNNIGDVDVLSVNAFPAHDAAIAGNPLRVAGRALTADYTAVAAGDTADIITTLLGKQVVYPYANPNQQWSYAAPAGGLVTQTAVTVKAAAGAGIRNYITDIQVVNSHATISTEITINDGAAGTVLWRGWLQAAGGGYSIHFNTPLRGTANTLLEIDEITATATAGVVFNAQGFVAAE